MSFRLSVARAMVLITGSALLLTGCTASETPGSAGSSATPSSSAAAPLPPAEGVTTYPLTLESPFGDTVLDARPQRIAVITNSTIDTDALLALDVTPVYAPSTLERNPWVSDETRAQIETLWSSAADATIAYEELAAVQPDLIVSLFSYEDIDQTAFDRLAAIAPVLYGAEEDATWQNVTLAVGDTLDLGAAARETVADAEQVIADARNAHPEFAGRTATHVIVYEAAYGTAYASAPGSDTAALFEGLGFSLPASAAQFVDDDTVSDELVGLLDSDFLLLSTFGEESQPFLDAPLLQSLAVVRDGRAVINDADPNTGTNSFAWALNVQSALSVPWLTEQLVEFAGQVIPADG